MFKPVALAFVTMLSFSGVVAAPAPPVTTKAASPDLLKDAGWEHYVEAGASADFQREGKQFRIKTTQTGNRTDSVQAWLALPSLQDGTKYTLTFDAKADRESTFGFVVGQRDAPYKNAGLLRQEESVGTQWRTYTCAFTAHNGNNGPGGVIKTPSFEWNKLGTLYLRRVSLKPTL
ncbi:MAG: carbohydrate binding domain-containing protein [Akkermansiaceae bacterium]|nr:carbohydrate binding domain-containing protein [Armatimonadota bacterium]